MMNWRVPLFEPDITEDDLQAALQPLRDKWLTMGERTQQFETAFADKLDSKHTFAVSNGTAALHLAMLALQIQPGDEVLLPSLTFVACANIVRAVGAKPVFVDVIGENDWTLSPGDLQTKITNRSKAILVVHYAGFPCRMDEIKPIAERYSLAIVEDCAHALVSTHQGISCGCWGDIGCFSFFSNKNMTTGEGGMVTTQNPGLADRIRLVRSHGMTSLTLDRHKGRAISYDVQLFGLNYRIDEIRSALGHSQLKRLDSHLRRRREIYRSYVNRLADAPQLTLPFLDRNPEHTGLHIFPILLRSAEQRPAFIQALKDNGIQTSIHYPPIHTFSAYREYLQGADCACPLTESIATREVTLPFYPNMTEEQVEMVCKAVLDF